MTTYEIQHMRGWRRFARTVRAASRAEAERLCLPWEWVDDGVPRGDSGRGRGGRALAAPERGSGGEPGRPGAQAGRGDPQADHGDPLGFAVGGAVQLFGEHVRVRFLVVPVPLPRRQAFADAGEGTDRRLRPSPPRYTTGYRRLRARGGIGGAARPGARASHHHAGRRAPGIQGDRGGLATIRSSDRAPGSAGRYAPGSVRPPPAPR